MASAGGGIIAPPRREGVNTESFSRIMAPAFDKAASGAQNHFVFASFVTTDAQVAELADALDSGSSAGNGVEVRILSWAPITYGFLDFAKTAFVT